MCARQECQSNPASQTPHPYRSSQPKHPGMPSSSGGAGGGGGGGSAIMPPLPPASTTCQHHHGCPQCLRTAEEEAAASRHRRPTKQQQQQHQQPQPTMRKRPPHSKAAAAAEHAVIAESEVRPRRFRQQQQEERTMRRGLGSSYGSSSMDGGGGHMTPLPPLVQGRRRGRRWRKSSGGLWGGLMAWAQRPFAALAAVVAGERVLPLDSPFRRAWDVLTVCLSVVFLCIDAASMLHASSAAAAHAGSDSSNSKHSGAGASSSPSSQPSSAAALLGPQELVLLEIVWFTLDVALQFRTEVETTTVEEDPLTGEERERTVILDTPRAIAAHYLQRGFWLDLLLSFYWRGLGALLLLPPRRKRPNRVRRLLGHIGRTVGGALSKSKRAVGDRVPRALRWNFIRRFFTWTSVLEVKCVDGAKHLMRNRKKYRLLRSFIRGLRRLLRPHVFAFGWRIGSKMAAHWAVGTEEEHGEWGEEWEEEEVTAAGSTRSNIDDDCDEGEEEGPEGWGERPY